MLTQRGFLSSYFLDIPMLACKLVYIQLYVACHRLSHTPQWVRLQLYPRRVRTQ